MPVTTNKITFIDSTTYVNQRFGETAREEGPPTYKLISKKKRQRISRNRGGCFCCRKRKIKCDERKPVCLKCEKGSFLCCWPENGHGSLSHDNSFKLVKLENTAKFINMNPVVTTGLRKSKDSEEAVSSSAAALSELEDIGEQTETVVAASSEKEKPVLDEDALIRRYIRESAKDTIPISIDGLSGLGLNKDEQVFYDAFVNGFIVSISNQLAHQKLLPGSIFVPTALFDPLIQKLCLTCGASFLYRCSAGKDKELLRKVKESSSLIVKELIHRLDEMPIMETREWILMYFTLQNNRQKFVYEGRHSQTLNLIAGVQAIKMWIETKKKDSGAGWGAKIEELNQNQKSNNPSAHYPNESFTSTAFPVDSSLNMQVPDYRKGVNDNNVTNDNFDGDIYRIDEFNEADSYILLDKLVNKTNLLKSTTKDYSGDLVWSTSDSNRKATGHLVDMLENEAQMILSSFNNADKPKRTTEVTAFERTLLETFIFNYSGTLLIIEKSLIGCVTSPFELFDMIAPLLFAPIYHCAVPWMNNPTAGAALPMIELQAKIIWLSFKEHFDQEDLKMIHTIQKVARYYTRPILPDEIWSSYPKNVSKKLLESCYVSEIVAKGVYLFSLKILDRSLQEADEKVQKIVESMFKILDCISVHSQTSVIAKWAFLVIGSAILDESQRAVFRKRLLGFIDALKTGSLRTSLVFLETVWKDGIGLDALFIEKYLDLLAI